MRRIVLGVAVIAVGSSSGCMTTAPVGGPALGAAGFLYQGGTATQGFPGDLAEVERGAIKSMAELNVTSIRKSQDNQTSYVDGKSADGRNARISIQPNGAQSVVSVRFGWFGDEALSKALLDRIAINLGTKPAEAIPFDPPSTPEPNPYFSHNGKADPDMLRDQSQSTYRDSPVP